MSHILVLVMYCYVFEINLFSVFFHKMYIFKVCFIIEMSESIIFNLTLLIIVFSEFLAIFLKKIIFLMFFQNGLKLILLWETWNQVLLIGCKTVWKDSLVLFYVVVFYVELHKTIYFIFNTRIRRVDTVFLSNYKLRFMIVYNFPSGRNIQFNFNFFLLFWWL